MHIQKPQDDTSSITSEDLPDVSDLDSDSLASEPSGLKYDENYDTWSDSGSLQHHTHHQPGHHKTQSAITRACIGVD